MKDTDLLQQYIEAAIESSTRTRQILLVMIVTSILIFAACWNSREGGWLNTRLQTARAEVAQVEQSNGKVSFIEEARLWWLQKIRTEQVSQIQVPFLGISFDVNDLGMLGGFAFAVLLVWVNYSLWHQSTNIRMAFSLAEITGSRDSYGEGSYPPLFYTYQNLAMRQVLTIPPQPRSIRGKDSDEPTFWLKLSKVLYALPLAVHTFVVGHDLVTINIAWILSSTGTKFALIAEFLLWLLIVILTVICFRRWKKTYETWKTVADNI